MPLPQNIPDDETRLGNLRQAIDTTTKALRECNALKAVVGRRIQAGASLVLDVDGKALTALNIKAGIQLLASRLVLEYAQDVSDPPVFIALMNGAMPFAHALQMALSRRGLQFEFTTMEVKSYQGTTSGDLSITSAFGYPIAGRRVVILDDIADTLKTGNAVKAFLETHGAVAPKLAVLLDKKGVRSDLENNPDYIGFEIDNQFVIGCGMDYLDLCRYLCDGSIKVVDQQTLPDPDELATLGKITALNAELIQLKQEEKALAKALEIKSQASNLGLFAVSEAAASSDATPDTLVPANI